MEEIDVSVYYVDHSFQFALHMPTLTEKEWKLFVIDTNLNTSGAGVFYSEAPNKMSDT